MQVDEVASRAKRGFTASLTRQLIVQTLRMAPAMAAGVTGHIWKPMEPVLCMEQVG